MYSINPSLLWIIVGQTTMAKQCWSPIVFAKNYNWLWCFVKKCTHERQLTKLAQHPDKVLLRRWFYFFLVLPRVFSCTSVLKPSNFWDMSVILYISCVRMPFSLWCAGIMSRCSRFQLCRVLHPRCLLFNSETGKRVFAMFSLFCPLVFLSTLNSNWIFIIPSLLKKSICLNLCYWTFFLSPAWLHKVQIRILRRPPCAHWWQFRLFGSAARYFCWGYWSVWYSAPPRKFLNRVVAVTLRQPEGQGTSLHHFKVFMAPI